MKGGKRPGSGRKPGVSKATELKRKIQDHFSDDEVQDLIVVNGEKDEIKANGITKHGDIITNGHVANGHGFGLDSMDSI